MRLLLLTFFFLTKFGPVIAQVEKEKSLPSDSILLEEVNSIVRTYQLAVIKAARCNENKTGDSIAIELAKNKMRKDAIIEVTNFSHVKKSYTRDVYFQHLLNLCRARNYTEVKVDFIPELIPWSNIIRDGGKCVVNKKITQRFIIYRNGKKLYCDITIKTINILFQLDKNNRYKGFITNVTAEWPAECD